MKRMNSINKIKKQKLNIFNNKLLQFIRELQNLIETKGFNVRIDKYIAALVQQTNRALTQGDRILTSLQKQSGTFCCGRTDQTKYTFYKAIINIIGHGYIWAIIPKFSPVVQQKIEKIEILTPIKCDFNYLQNLIEKQIQNYWPDYPSSNQPQRCQKPHVESQIIESRPSSVSSLSQSSEQKQKPLNQANNYITIEEVNKLKQDLDIQISIRQAHQKFFGFGRPQETAKAIEVYKKISEKKNNKSGLALNSLGQIYEEGKFIESDRQKSEQYYQRSAGLNDSEGLYKIGKYLQKGLVKISKGESNFKKKRQDQIRLAIQYYQKAAQMGHLDAITDLGYIYQKGVQNNKQMIKASKVSRSQSQGSQLSQQTNTNSQFFIEPNFNYALKYYTLAKKKEFPRAINNLGALLLRENQSISQRVKGTNLQKGVKYLKKAVQLNYSKAYFNIAKCYENGIGVQKNYETAKKYLQKGSEKGDISCKVQYIKCFFTDGFPKNGQTDQYQISQLLKLINQVLALDQKNKECLFYLGVFYQQGQGVVKNPQIAYKLVEKSANLNFLPAITKLGDFKYSGFFVNKDLEQAVTLYETAAKQGQPQAMINLSIILQKGLIKPNKGSSPDFIKYLQKQALQKKSSNAYLMAGLRDINYNLDKNNQNQINSKLMKSLEMGNRDTINLVQKLQNNKIQNSPSNSSNNYVQKFTLQPKQVKNNLKTVKNQKQLKYVKSADNLKTTRF